MENENLILSVDSDRATVVADLNKLSERISQIIAGADIDVIVDGHYASNVVSSDIVSYAFVLRLDPNQLGERLRARGYSESKVLENIVSEILDICLVDNVREYGFERVDEIDVTNMSVEEVVGEILHVLRGQRKCRIGLVDWIARLEKDEKLDKFLTLLNKM